MTPFDFMMNALYIMAGVVCLLLTIAGVYFVGTGISNDTRKDRIKRALQKEKLFNIEYGLPHRGRLHDYGPPPPPPSPPHLSDCRECWCGDCAATLYEIYDCAENPCINCTAGHRHKPKEEPPCDNFSTFYPTAK